MTEQIIKEHLKEVAERKKRYHEEKKEDVQVKYIYESFLHFVNDIGFLIDRSSPQVLRFLAQKEARGISKILHFAVRTGDDNAARFYMERFMAIYEKLFDDLVCEEKKDPEFFKEPDLKIEVKAPTFFCSKCADRL